MLVAVAPIRAPGVVKIFGTPSEGTIMQRERRMGPTGVHIVPASVAERMRPGVDSIHPSEWVPPAVLLSPPSARSLVVDAELILFVQEGSMRVVWGFPAHILDALVARIGTV